MKEYAITIFVSVLALSSYAWDRSNTHINHFIDTSTTISENLAPTKNIHINDQGNFLVKYPEGDTEKEHGYTDEDLWKASSPIDVVVKSGVEIKAEVYSPNAGAYVDATFQVGKANLTLEDNNTITASQMILSDGANVYAENAFNEISDSIPIDKCRQLGYDKIIVVLTRPLWYRKKKANKFLSQIVYKKYPNLIKSIQTRYKKYNDTVEKIIDLESKKEIFVIRPSKTIKIKRIERDANKLQEMYDLGVQDCKVKLDELKKFINY